MEGKKQGLVTKLSKSESKGDGSLVSTKPMGAEAEGTSAPHDPGAGLGEHEVKAILDYKKKHPSMGSAQIRAQLKRFLGWRVSVKAIARVLRKAGYAPVHRKGRPVGDEHPRRFEAAAPQFVMAARLLHADDISPRALRDRRRCRAPRGLWLPRRTIGAVSFTIVSEGNDAARRNVESEAGPTTRRGGTRRRQQALQPIEKCGAADFAGKLGRVLAGSRYTSES